MDPYRVEAIRHWASEFALTSETLALKKSANIRIFEQVKQELDARLLEGKDKEEDLPKKEKQRPS